MCDKISEKIKNQTILTKNKHYLFIHYLMKFWIMNIKKKKITCHHIFLWHLDSFDGES